METIILPGFSLKNKTWAEETQSGLSPKVRAVAINWTHWETGAAEPDWIDEEVKKAISLIQDKKVNIIAKSIGTAVAMGIFKQNPTSLGKIILCGIPVRDFLAGDENRYEPLKAFSVDKVLCIQNADDNHGSYAEVEKFVHSINALLNIISKPRSDHEYPYLDEFINFLQQ